MKSGDRIVIGLSGGVDSVALCACLSALKERLGIKLYPIYVNHGIREEALEDELFCQGFANTLGLPLEIVRVDVPDAVAKTGRSEEDVARELRYKAMEGYLRDIGGTLIAVAHHREDQAETVLHRLIRGSGGLGLIGMRYKSGHIIRPLLAISKSELEEYVRMKGCSHVVDHTNRSTKYTRNRLRHELIPLLEKEYNGNIIDTLNRMSSILIEDESFIEEEAVRIYKEVAVEEAGRVKVDINGLTRQKKAIARRIVRYAISHVRGNLKNIELHHVEECLELAGLQSGRRIELPGDCIAYREFDRIVVMKESKRLEGMQGFRHPIDTLPDKGYIQDIRLRYEVRVVTRDAYCEALNYKDSLKKTKNVYTKWFDYDKIETNLVLRSREVGDFIGIHPDGGTKTIKRYFIDEKIPASVRNRIPLLATEKEVLWVVGYRTNPNYSVTEDSKAIIELKLYKEDNNDRH